MERGDRRVRGGSHGAFWWFGSREVRQYMHDMREKGVGELTGNCTLFGLVPYRGDLAIAKL